MHIHVYMHVSDVTPIMRLPGFIYRIFIVWRFVISFVVNFIIILSHIYNGVN